MGFKTQVNSLFEDWFGRSMGGVLAPRVDVAEDEKAVTLTAELPGAPSNCRTTQVRRDARGRRRLLPRPAGAGGRALCRREEPDPGPRPHPAGSADQPWSRWDDDARLQAPRHHHPVRRAQHPRRHRGRPLHAAPPHQEFIKFLNAVEAPAPARQAIHAIADNYATHKHPKVRQWLARHPRWAFHFTPTTASWLNAVEGFFPRLATSSPSRARSAPSTRTRRRLQEDIRSTAWSAPTAPSNGP